MRQPVVNHPDPACTSPHVSMLISRSRPMDLAGSPNDDGHGPARAPQFRTVTVGATMMRGVPRFRMAPASVVSRHREQLGPTISGPTGTCPIAASATGTALSALGRHIPLSRREWRSRALGLL